MDLLLLRQSKITLSSRELTKQSVCISNYTFEGCYIKWGYNIEK